MGRLTRLLTIPVHVWAGLLSGYPTCCVVYFCLLLLIDKAGEPGRLFGERMGYPMIGPDGTYSTGWTNPDWDHVPCIWHYRRTPGRWMRLKDWADSL